MAFLNVFVLVSCYIIPKDVIKIKHSQSANPAEQSTFPCKIRQITQYVSVGNTSYTPVLINLCYGGCLSISVPSKSIFINTLCTTCKDTGKVLKDVVFFKGTEKETTMQFESVTGCKCQICNKSV